MSVKLNGPSIFRRTCSVCKQKQRQVVSLPWLQWVQDGSSTKPASALFFSTLLDQVCTACKSAPLQGPYTFMCMGKGEERNVPNTISVVIRMCGYDLWPLRSPSLNPTTYYYIILLLHHPTTTSSTWMSDSSPPHLTSCGDLVLTVTSNFLYVTLEKHKFSLLQNPGDTCKRGSPSKRSRLSNASEIWSQPCSFYSSILRLLNITPEKRKDEVKFAKLSMETLKKKYCGELEKNKGALTDYL